MPALRFSVVVFLVAFAGLTRLLPHPANFAPLAAMALFSGAMAQRAWQGIGLTIGATWLSDLMVNNILYAGYFQGFVWFYDGFYWQYGAYILMALLAHKLLPNRGLLPITGMTLTATLLFFIISNFGVWVSGGIYPPTAEGLAACYVAALPFLRNAILGDVIYSALLFGGAWAVSLLPRVKLV